jgi:hypothetical protein
MSGKPAFAGFFFASSPLVATAISGLEGSRGKFMALSGPVADIGRF